MTVFDEERTSSRPFGRPGTSYPRSKHKVTARKRSGAQAMGKNPDPDGDGRLPRRGSKQCYLMNRRQVDGFHGAMIDRPGSNTFVSNTPCVFSPSLANAA